MTPSSDALTGHSSQAFIQVDLLRLADLDEVALSQCLSWLSTDEVARAERHQDRHMRRLSIVSRALLRYGAGNILQQPPAQVCVAAEPSGKPLIRAEAETPLHVSVSHHGDWVAAAFASEPVGVDLETVVAPDRLKLARRFFLAEESAWLDSLPQDQATEAFTWLWTLKEAEVKRQGSALARVLGSRGFHIDQGLIRPIISRPMTDSSQPLAQALEEPVEYWLFQPAERCCLALAFSILHGPQPQIRSGTFAAGFSVQHCPVRARS